MTFKKKIHLIQTHGLGDVLMTLPLIISLIEFENRVVISVKNPQAFIILNYLKRDLKVKFNILLVPSLKEPIKLFKYFTELVNHNFDFTYSCFEVNKSLSRIINFLSIYPIYKSCSDFTIPNKLKNLEFHKVHLNQIMSYDQQKQFNLISRKEYSSLLNNQKLELNLNKLRKKFDFLYSNKKIFIVSPGSGELEKHKRWPTKSYAELSTNIIKNIDNAIVIITGSPADKHLAQEFDLSNENIINLIGKCNFAELFYLYKISKIVFTHCSGAAHIAALAGSQIFFFSGPTSYELTGPFSDKVLIFKSGSLCSPCYSKENLQGCMYEGCQEQMKNIDVKTVLKELMNKKL